MQVKVVQLQQTISKLLYLHFLLTQSQFKYGVVKIMTLQVMVKFLYLLKQQQVQTLHQHKKEI